VCSSSDFAASLICLSFGPMLIGALLFLDGLQASYRDSGVVLNMMLYGVRYSSSYHLLLV
jgi:hypothetical protein